MADIKEVIQMKKRHFDVETDGFYGVYWKCKTGLDCAMIAMIGDDPEDYLARTSVKWLHKLGVNVMTMSPGKKDYRHKVEVWYLKQQEINQIQSFCFSMQWE